MSICCKKGGPLQDLRMGSCLTLRSELFKTPILAKQETLLARGAWWRAAGSRNPEGWLCHVAPSFGVFSDGVSFQVVSGQSF